jgi:adenylate kinase family enzyme
MRIVIIGYSGSGKSTVANWISSQAYIPVLHIDSVRWHAGWKQRSDDEMNVILSNFMSDHHDWIIEGTYHRFKFEERLQLADMILILALPRIQCFVRAYKRYLKYKGTVRPDMAPGCKEQFDFSFVWWLLVQERTKKRRDLF